MSVDVGMFHNIVVSILYPEMFVCIPQGACLGGHFSSCFQPVGVAVDVEHYLPSSLYQIQKQYV